MGAPGSDTMLGAMSMNIAAHAAALDEYVVHIADAHQRYSSAS